MFRKFILPAVAAACFLAAEEAPVKLPPPSANAGKRGQYRCDLSNAEYKYFVYVPATYAADKPAGIHLFFPDPEAAGGAESFDVWKTDLLEPQNLIGINMQFLDKANGKDTEGKARAAGEALRQTLADYKIIAGRGVVASFGDGGLVHGALFARNGRSGNTRGSGWPFSHTALYGSNFTAMATSAMPMTWFLGVGQMEWEQGDLSIGKSLSARANELFQGVPKGDCSDILFKVTPQKGHVITPAEIKASAAQFKRSAVAFAPFVYEPDFQDKGLAELARMANQRRFAAVAKGLEALLNGEAATPETKAKAGLLQQAVNAQVGAMVGLVRDLRNTDPGLFAFYARRFQGELNGLPQRNEPLAKPPRVSEQATVCGGGNKNNHYI
ncbi:MAG: hypothetical protein ABIF71_07070 [Planctomycetota bacterium]